MEGLQLHRMTVKTSRVVGCSVALGSCSSRWCLSVYGRCCETLCSHTPGHARGWEMMPAWHVVIDWSGLWLRAAATKSTLRPGQWGVVRLVWIYRSAPSLCGGLLSFVLVSLTVFARARAPKRSDYWSKNGSLRGVPCSH